MSKANATRYSDAVSPAQSEENFGGCLRLSLYRHLALKYGFHDEKDQGRKRSDPQDIGWSVVGEHDALTIDQYQNLNEATERVGVYEGYDSQHVLVYPFHATSVGKQFVTSIASEPGTGAIPDVPLLVVVSILLSPTCYGPGNSASAYSVHERFIKHMQTSTPSSLNDRVSFYGSLGGPDIVLIAAPRNSSELASVSELVDAARSLERETITTDTAPLNKSFGGHAAVVVVPMLAFRKRYKNFYHSTDFGCDDAKELQIQIQIRTDPGHEKQVLDKLSSHPKYGFTPLLDKGVGWDTHPIVGIITGFGAFVTLWTDCLFNQGWRETNIVDSVSTTIWPDNGYGMKQLSRIWEMDVDLAKELQAIRDSFCDFADQYLPSPRAFDLHRSVNRFVNAFYRQDVPTPMDLLPFCRTMKDLMSIMMNEESGVPGAVSGDYETSRDFGDDVDRFVRDFRRAVEDRTDDRSITGQPPYAKTLYDGAGRLVGIFSAIFYLAWEMFEDGDGAFATTDRYSTCVVAGTEARVEWREVFKDVWIEKEKALVRGMDRNNEMLSTCPVMLHLSGRSLLAPEEAFVHFLHEAAEIRWSRGANAVVLSSIMERWVRTVTEEAIARRLRKQIGASSKGTMIRLSVEKCLILAECYVEKMCHDGQSDKDVENEPEPAGAMLPHEYCNWLVWRDKQMSLDEHWLFETLARLDLERDEFVPGIESIICRPDDAVQKWFRNWMAFYEQLALEVCADIGAWAALSRITKMDAQDLSGCLSSLGRVFGSIFELASDTARNSDSRIRMADFVMVRWAIQCAAVAGERDWREEAVNELVRFITIKIEEFDFRGHIETRLPGYLKREELFGQQGDGSSLVGSLRMLSLYDRTGGTQHLKLAAVPPEDGSNIADAFKDFNEVWSMSMEAQHSQTTSGNGLTRARIRLLRSAFDITVNTFQPNGLFKLSKKS